MKLNIKHKICYGIGNLGYSAVNQTITNFFMFFGTSVLKIPGTFIGLAIALSMVWDAITDPVVGFVSDNKKLGCFGYRNGYMLIGAIGVSIANLFIWCVPTNLSVAAKFVWVLISLIFNETFCTLYSTPYGALSGDLATEYNDRTVIQVYKTIFFLIGMILPSLLLNIFLPSTPEYPQGQLNPNGYKNIAIVCSLIMIVCGVICVVGTLKISKDKKCVGSNQKIGFKTLFISFFDCLKDECQRVVVLGYAISMISATILTSVGLHFFTYCFNYKSSQITVLLALLLVGMILSQPLWCKVSLKNDKKPTLLSGLLVAICGVVVIMLTYVFRSTWSLFSFYVIAAAIFVVGAGAGVLYTLPASMYLDVVALVSKQENGGSAVFQSFLTFSANFLNAITLLIVGVLLDLIGFNPNNMVQSRPVQMGIAIILFLGVLISLIGSFFIFSRYKLKQKHFKNEQ